MQFTQDWFSQHTHNWERWLGRFKDEPIQALEIGSYEGRSAVWLLRNILTHPDSHLTCVDPFAYDTPLVGYDLPDIAAAKARFLANMAELNSTRWEHQCVDSLSFFRANKKSFDLIYIDGNHHPSAVLVDLVLAWLCLNENGVMICDDYLWHAAERTPKEAIDGFATCLRGQYDIIGWGYQFALRKTVRLAT